MSFSLGHYKDHILNKLGECKDRGAAALKQVDNCKVKLILKSLVTDGDMPFYGLGLGGSVVRSRSNSSCKHKHSIQYTYPPQRRCAALLDDYSDDSDSDCGCGDCVTVHRGRRRRRDAPLVEVNAYEGCRGRSRSHSRVYVVPRSRSRPRYIIPPYDSDDELFYSVMRGPSGIPGLQQTSRHQDGRCCIHGASWLVPCESCVRRIWRYLPHSGPRYRLMQNDDGKVDIFDTEVLWKKAKEAVEKVDKVEREKKEDEEKKLKEDIEDVKKLLQGHQGYYWPPEIYRSANDIRKELAHVNADLKQCRSRATAIALMNGAINEEEVRRDIAHCDGLLEVGDDVARVPVGQGKLFKSILKTGGKGDVSFVEVTKARVEDVTDE